MAAAPKTSIPSSTKLLTVVAGRAFQPIPSAGASKVSVTLCAEETEPATFSVRCAKSMAKVRASAATDFVGPGNIPRASVEVSRVDGEQLVNALSPSSGVVYTEADIGPSPVQFWVNVTVPRRTPAGTYKGAISFSCQNKTIDAVPIEVKVLNLRLIGSSKQYVLYTSYGPDSAGPDAQDYCKFLNAFKRLGFKQIAVNADPSRFGEAMAAYNAAGMMSPVPVLTYAFSPAAPSVEDVKALCCAASSAGMRSLLFVPNDLPCDADQLSAAQAQIDAFKRARMRAVARITDEMAIETLKKTLDGIDYHVDTPYVQALIKCEASRTSSKWEWFWWDARKSAMDNRVLAGVALWRTGLDGCMPAWMPVDGKAPTDGTSSMLGEALREGIDDTRYITTYMKALRELKDLKREGDKDYIASTEAYLNAFMHKPIEQVTIASLAELRSKMTEFAMTLERRL